MAILWGRGLRAAEDATRHTLPGEQPSSTSTLHSFSEVSISPDGHFVVWSEEVDTEKASSPTPPPSLYVADLRAPADPPRRITAEQEIGSATSHSPAKRELVERNPTFSPNGRQIAFLSDADKQGQQQIYVIPIEGGLARRLTNLTSELSGLHWSSDGKQISYLFIEHPPRLAGPSAPVPQQTGVIGEKPFERRLGIVDLASGETRPLSPPDLYIYEYA